MRGRRVPLWLELSAAILLALVVSNAVTFALAEYDRSRAIKAERLSAIQDRLGALMGLLARLPAGDQGALLRVASVRHERVSIGKVPRVGLLAARDDESEAKLRAALGALATGEVRVAKRGSPVVLPFMPAKRGGIERLSVAIALSPDRWLNAEFSWPEGGDLLPGLLLSAGVAALALVVMAVWISMRLSAPLQLLSDASARMAAGRAVEPIPERGPFVVRNAAQAFNTMSRRLIAMLDNQRSLLGSIAHDLRTPITSLKLKSEFIDDAELRECVRASLDELQTMTEAALDAARTGLGEEAPREVDVAALVESVCDDLADLGSSVTFARAQPMNVRCRPNELKRAVRNLVENGVKYGTRARVAVEEVRGRLAIVVDDDGPGLEPSAIARVFEPFARGKSGTVRGLGLGLTLARAVARAQGGDVVLANREGGGLRATLTLKASAGAE